MKTLIQSGRRSITGLAILFTIMAGLINCSKSADSNPTPGANEVFIQSGAFDPVTITVAANTTVTWTNKEGTAHTVTSNAGSSETFDSGSLSINATFPHLFATPGSYSYHCTFHSNMNGTVIVN
jgi:plastocyanin